jgi:hypothetical protein
MKKNILAVVLAAALGTVAFAQSTPTTQDPAAPAGKTKTKKTKTAKTPKTKKPKKDGSSTTPAK